MASEVMVPINEFFHYCNGYLCEIEQIGERYRGLVSNGPYVVKYTENCMNPAVALLDAMKYASALQPNNILWQSKKEGE